MSHAWLGRLRRYTAVLALAATASFLMLAGEANAATFVVHNAAELESAVTTANGNKEANTIELTAGTYSPTKTLVFTNTSGTQTLAGPAGKLGEDTPSATLSGSAVLPDPPVSEKELIIVDAGVKVTLTHVIVTNGGSDEGNAAIDDLGTLGVENSTISGNTGSQIFVESGATADLTNSTLANGLAAGLIDEGAASLQNVTVVDNKESGIAGTGTVSLTNTIVALNKGSAQCGISPITNITNDHSLASDASCGGEAALQNKTPLLTALGNDGGSTTLLSEKAGSPTIDAGDAAKCPATDQRGYPRPYVGGTGCDIGSDEYSPTPPTIIVPAEIVTPTTGTGAVVTYSVEASDLGSLVKKLECAPASGSTFKNGTTKVECTAVDGHENTAKASFNVKVTTLKHTLTVTASGEGTVTSTPAGIECGQGHTLCSAEFEEVEVKLTPTPAAGNSVLWSGACSGGGSCSFNPMSANEAVTATFSSVPVNTGLPVISGTPYSGLTLKTTTGSWTASPTSYTYQWEDCNSSGTSCTSIEGATGTEYTLTGADIGHTVRVVVIAHNASGASAPVESAATAVVTASESDEVHGEVPFEQKLTSNCHVNLGKFYAGVAEKQTHEGECSVVATSTAAESQLTAEDQETGNHEGHLVHYDSSDANREFYLDDPLETDAVDHETGNVFPGPGTGAPFAPLTSKVTLLSWADPINLDPVTVTFRQYILEHERLNTGTYSKVITLTLSTTTP